MNPDKIQHHYLIRTVDILYTKCCDSNAPELPSDMCSGLNLVVLTVNNNSFSGPLPNSLRNCSSLTRVRLDDNQFSGNMTEAFGVHPNLNFISISRNRLDGHLSLDCGKCISLTDMEMSGNKLSGKIPSELSNRLNKLQFLSPPEIGNIPMNSLEYRPLSLA